MSGFNGQGCCEEGSGRCYWASLLFFSLASGFYDAQVFYINVISASVHVFLEFLFLLQIPTFVDFLAIIVVASCNIFGVMDALYIVTIIAALVLFLELKQLMSIASCIIFPQVDLNQVILKWS